MNNNRQRFIVAVVVIIVIGVTGIILFNVFFDFSTPVVPVDETEIARLSATGTATAPATLTATPSPAPTATRVPENTATPTPAAPPTATPALTAELPEGGIVYAISPDNNSVGWVQSNQATNHFGESYIYVGNRAGVEYQGAMQFDLSFVPPGSTIFFAELSLNGLVDEGLPEQGTWIINILDESVSEQWAGHGFDVISNAPVDEIVTPFLQARDLKRGTSNNMALNAAQRGLIQERLQGESSSIAFRIDGRELGQEGWFAWDSGFGDATLGNGPVLRLGVIAATPQPTAEIVTPTPGTPTATPTFVVVTSTPTPENVFTAAAIALTATSQATTIGTATPAPDNWVTPFAVTSVPTPQNQATAAYIIAEATAEAIVNGTATPTPPNMFTVTPTPIFVLLDGDLPPITPTPSPTPDARTMPPELIGKIAFLSDRGGEDNPQVYVIKPDGTGLALLTSRWPYDLAFEQDKFSVDGRYRAFVKGGGSSGVRAPSVFYYDDLADKEEQLTFFGRGIAYDPVWSPANAKIAFVATDTGNDEIWIVNQNGSELLQLTDDNFSWWDKRPSFSPDGSQIVFWSNRSGARQIWVMNIDGSGLHRVIASDFNDWDPVWIKYVNRPPITDDKE